LKKIQKHKQGTSNNNDISPDGFVGVERRRNKTKRIFLSGIASSVNEKHIQAYLDRQNIIPTHISVFPSKRKGTVSAKVNLPAVAFPLVQRDDFWPSFVTCKLWQPKDNLGKIIKPEAQTKAPQGETPLSEV
jgi:hypothetical protein